MTKRNYTIFQLLPLANLLLIACSAHTPPVPTKYHTSLKWRTHQQAISALSHYQIHGTLAYLSSQYKVYAHFAWQQININHYRLTLTNLFGGIEMDLYVQPGIVHLVNKHGERYINNDPEVIIQKLIGISIPLKELQHWILGLPGEAIDFTLNSRGYLHTINYNHNGQYWTVTYQDYHDNTAPALPLTLELRHGNNCIQLQINTWNL